MRNFALPHFLPSILLAILLTLLTACGGEESAETKEADAGIQLAQAQEFLDKKDYESAGKIIKEYVAAHPQDLAGLRLSAHFSLIQNRVNDAIAIAEQALEIDSERGDFLAIKGRAYYQVSQFDNALKFCREALKKDPTVGLAYLVIGEIFLRQGKIQESIPILKEAVQHDPKSVEGLNKLASAYIKVKDYQSAREYLERAQQLDNEDAGVYFNLALVYDEMNDGENAVKHIQESLRLYTDQENKNWANKARQTQGILAKKYNIRLTS
ncbi:MAG: tetratricopeptide repeat protein [Candidatus Nitrohelix vancouverensis]|uniref:Tetratricopeptide repeat protein n=1 Tax=Candidatus Nitrohelix vancouverensis TaxID=2705534 RepID=A0A7T0C1H7_9BACT|nr:MAG: tetratricopeptide repeat protein [Candidatus Nitrohelix vancouverensis]